MEDEMGTKNCRFCGIEDSNHEMGQQVTVKAKEETGSNHDYHHHPRLLPPK